ncbi:MAG: hypothetical protein LAT50_19745, partial [Ectothiorhodospiraceae bacterium]|nr:hypothetical protein [Ectothiorhodospiraceae bacterium]
MYGNTPPPGRWPTTLEEALQLLDHHRLEMVDCDAVAAAVEIVIQEPTTMRDRIRELEAQLQ